MKNLIYIFLFLVVSNISFGQKIEEKLLFSGAGTNVDAYSFYTDGNGNYAYVEYDQNSSRSRLITNKGNSDYYDVVNAEPKFDKNGNNYTTAYNFRKDTTYLADKNYLLMNGQKAAEMNNIDSYNAFINSDGQYQCIITENDKQYIGKFSSEGGMQKTGPYDVVKNIYAPITDSPVPMEGEDKQAQNLFKDKNGNYGYILIQNGKASIMFGNNIINTDYTDMLEISFDYDKAGNLTYIAKSNGIFYSGYGNEFVVQGNKKWNDFNSVTAPVKFTKDNLPVYVITDSINDNTYISRLVVGNDVYKVMNSSKTVTIDGYSGGIFDVNISDNGGISFTGQAQIISKNSDGYDEYSYKTVNVTNGVEGKAYYNQGVKRYNKSGAGLFCGATDKSDRKISLFFSSGNDTKIVSENKYDGINDYDFINGGSKYYYIGITYGDYEKGQRDKSDVYIAGDKVGTYESLLGQAGDNGLYSSIVFNNSGDYAFVSQKSTEKKVNGELSYQYYCEVVSNKDSESPSLPNGKENFEYIDNMRFVKNGKLFYIGYLYGADGASTGYLVLDGKIFGKPYSSLTNFKFNNATNTATFRASKSGSIYDVTVRF
ncbi:MAG: hypothetical protein JSS63_13180 [Bacteroidetes bacterium]|nr:hypothetical protein [Bacteroidota bacterium]